MNCLLYKLRISLMKIHLSLTKYLHPPPPRSYIPQYISTYILRDTGVQYDRGEMVSATLILYCYNPEEDGRLPNQGSG